MAKIVQEERMVITLVLVKEGGIAPIEISCRTEYDVTSDDLRETRAYKEKDSNLTISEKNAIISFAQTRLAKVKVVEE